MKRTMLALSASLVTLLASGTLLAEQVYKSVDETGKVIYFDRPPAEAVSTEELFHPSALQLTDPSDKEA